MISQSHGTWVLYRSHESNRAILHVLMSFVEPGGKAMQERRVLWISLGFSFDADQSTLRWPIPGLRDFRD